MFTLFPWGPLHRRDQKRDAFRALSEIKDCGFNASCFIDPDDLPACRAAGLYPTVYLYAENDRIEPGVYEGFTADRLGRKNLTFLARDKEADDETIERYMKEALLALPEGAYSVYLVDEPGAEWFHRVGKMIECVRKYRGDLTPYVNLFPNYAVCGAPDLSQLETPDFETYLDRFARETKPAAISLDNYMTFVSHDFQDPGGEARYYENFVQAREVCDRYDLPFHHVICSNQLRTFQPIPTYINLALQAYTSLAAGARSIAWYTYFGRGGYLRAPVDDNTDEDVRTDTWYLVREINRRILSLGVALENMAYEGLFFTDPENIARAKAVSECPAIEKFTSDERCVLGAYRDGDARAVLVCNGSMARSTRFDLTFAEKGEVEIWSTVRNRFEKPIQTDSHGNVSPMWLAPGEGALLRARG